MENIIVRDYKREDYPKITELWIKTGIWDPERNDREKSIEDSMDIGGRFLVLIDTVRNIFTGTCWLTFDSLRLRMHHFCTKPEYQHKGL